MAETAIHEKAEAVSDEMEIVASDGLPRPLRLVIDCPRCGATVEYEPAEDDAGNFYAEQDWPVCEPCDVLIDVPPIAIVKVDGLYHVSGAPR